MRYYPAYLDLKDRLVALVGGGGVAARKLKGLLAAGARVRLISPELHPETERAAAEGGDRVEVRRRGFEPADLDGAALAVSATDREAVNRAVAGECQKRGLFVNVVDVPGLCSFIVPATVARGELIVAASTGGASPAATRRLRERLERELGPAWEPFLRLMRAVRGMVASRRRPAAENRERFFALVDGGLFELVAARDAAGVDSLLARVLGPEGSLAALGWSGEDLAPREEV